MCVCPANLALLKWCYLPSSPQIANGTDQQESVGIGLFRLDPHRQVKAQIVAVVVVAVERFLLLTEGGWGGGSGICCGGITLLERCWWRLGWRCRWRSCS